MTSKSRKTLLFALAAVFVAGLFVVAFRPHPVPVDLAPVTRGPMEVTINADGKTRVRDLYEVSAPISGIALRSPIAQGAQVTGGESVVARIEPSAPTLIDTRTRVQLEAAVAEAQAAAQLATAQLRQAEQELSYAQSQFARTQALVEKGVSSITALEDAQQVLSIRQATRDAAGSNVQMAQSSLARAQAALIEPGADAAGTASCCVEIRAPISGTVLSISQVSEHAVSLGAPMLTLGALEALEIEAEILSSDAVALAPGARAYVERWGGAPPLEARLTQLSPQAQTHVSSLGIEEQRVDAVFDLVTHLEARAGLGHHYAVFLRIVTWEAEDVVQLPISALFRNGGGWAVFTRRGDQAELTPVEIGTRNETMAEVISGIDPTQEVIVHPSAQIADGVKIVDRTGL